MRFAVDCSPTPPPTTSTAESSIYKEHGPSLKPRPACFLAQCLDCRCGSWGWPAATFSQAPSKGAPTRLRPRTRANRQTPGGVVARRGRRVVVTPLRANNWNGSGGPQ